jgi:hypothetical protein
MKGVKRNNLMRMLDSVRFYFKLYGFGGGIRFALGLLTGDSEYVYCIDLKAIEKMFVNPKTEFEVRFICDWEEFACVMDDYAAAKTKWLALQDKKRIIEGNEFLAVVYKQNSLAGWGWVRRGPFRYGNNYLKKSECLIHKCRTIRSYRRAGVYYTLLVSLKPILGSKGYEKVYIGTKTFNKASIKGIEKAGFEFVEEYYLGGFVRRLLSRTRGGGLGKVS